MTTMLSTRALSKPQKLALIVPVISAIAYAVAWVAGLRQGLLFMIGIGYGVGLCAVAFGFTTGWRAWIVDRDAKGMQAQLVLVLAASTLCMPLLALFPDDLVPASGPLAVCMVLAAFVFGAAMQITDGCGSGTLYKAGQGNGFSLLVLPFFIVGAFLGSLHLDRWLALGDWGPVQVRELTGSQTSAWFAQAVVLLALLGWLQRQKASRPSRWQGPGIWWAAAGLALLASLNLVIAGQPWGIVYGFGLWGAKLTTWVGVDWGQHLFWGRAAQQLQLSHSVLNDVTTVTTLGLLGGSMATAWFQGKFCPEVKMTPKQRNAAIVAGLILGYSSRLAFGCNIGAFFAGISTGSLHGWVWFGAAFSGSYLGIYLRRRLGLSL